MDTPDTFHLTAAPHQPKGSISPAFSEGPTQASPKSLVKTLSPQDIQEHLPQQTKCQETSGGKKEWGSHGSGGLSNSGGSNNISVAHFQNPLLFQQQQKKELEVLKEQERQKQEDLEAWERFQPTINRVCFPGVDIENARCHPPCVNGAEGVIAQRTVCLDSSFIQEAIQKIIHHEPANNQVKYDEDLQALAQTPAFENIEIAYFWFAVLCVKEKFSDSAKAAESEQVAASQRLFQEMANADDDDDNDDGVASHLSSPSKKKKRRQRCMSSSNTSIMTSEDNNNEKINVNDNGKKMTSTSSSAKLKSGCKNDAKNNDATSPRTKPDFFPSITDNSSPTNGGGAQTEGKLARRSSSLAAKKAKESSPPPAAVSEFEKNEKDLFHVIAMNYGELFHGINFPKSGEMMIHKDHLISMLPLIVSKSTYYMVTHQFNLVEDERSFGAWLRTKLCRAISYWITGVQPERIDINRWEKYTKPKNVNLWHRDFSPEGMSKEMDDAAERVLLLATSLTRSQIDGQHHHRSKNQSFRRGGNMAIASQRMQRRSSINYNNNSPPTSSSSLMRRGSLSPSNIGGMHHAAAAPSLGMDNILSPQTARTTTSMIFSPVSNTTNAVVATTPRGLPTSPMAAATTVVNGSKKAPGIQKITPCLPPPKFTLRWYEHGKLFQGHLSAERTKEGKPTMQTQDLTMNSPLMKYYLSVLEVDILVHSGGKKTIHWMNLCPLDKSAKKLAFSRLSNKIARHSANCVKEDKKVAQEVLERGRRDVVFVQRAQRYWEGKCNFATEKLIQLYSPRNPSAVEIRKRLRKVLVLALQEQGDVFENLKMYQSVLAQIKDEMFQVHQPWRMELQELTKRCFIQMKLLERKLPALIRSDKSASNFGEQISFNDEELESLNAVYTSIVQEGLTDHLDSFVGEMLNMVPSSGKRRKRGGNEDETMSMDSTTATPEEDENGRYQQDGLYYPASYIPPSSTFLLTSPLASASPSAQQRGMRPHTHQDSRTRGGEPSLSSSFLRRRKDSATIRETQALLRQLMPLEEEVEAQQQQHQRNLLSSRGGVDPSFHPPQTAPYEVVDVSYRFTGSAMKEVRPTTRDSVFPSAPSVSSRTPSRNEASVGRGGGRSPFRSNLVELDEELLTNTTSTVIPTATGDFFSKIPSPPAAISNKLPHTPTKAPRHQWNTSSSTTPAVKPLDSSTLQGGRETVSSSGIHYIPCDTPRSTVSTATGGARTPSKHQVSWNSNSPRPVGSSQQAGRVSYDTVLSATLLHEIPRPPTTVTSQSSTSSSRCSPPEKD